MSDEARRQEQFLSAHWIVLRRFASVLEAGQHAGAKEGRAALPAEYMKLTGAVTLWDRATDDLLNASDRGA